MVSNPSRARSRAARRVLFALALAPAVFVSGAVTAAAQLPSFPLDPPPQTPSPQAQVQEPPPQGIVAAPKTMDLAACLGLASQNQPRIAAQRASLAAAEDAKRALDNLMAPNLIAPELPVRRRQAGLGVIAASAGLEQAERETTYGVTRTYLSVLYARDQERVAQGVVDRITATRNAAKDQLDAGARDVTATDVNRATTYLGLVKTKRTQAAQGVKRALAALKEAVGLGQHCPLDIPAGGLWETNALPTADAIVAAAVARRPEVIRAGVFAEVVCLEVEAQGTSIHRKMETFAVGSDIHAAHIPAGVQNGEFRPGAVPPEMPTLLAGTRNDRVKRAQSLHARALASADVARNLVALEATDAFLRWEQATQQVQEAREAATAGEGVAKDLDKRFTAGAKVKVEEVVNAWVLAAQARSAYNEALYHQLIALADLERVSAGAFCARLTDPPAKAENGK